MRVSINPLDFQPPVHIYKDGRECRKMPGQPRKVPRDSRKSIYQLMLTAYESEQEILRILKTHGIETRQNVARHKLAIWRDQG